MVNFSELARRAELVRPCCSVLLLLVAAGCSDPSAPRTGAVQAKLAPSSTANCTVIGATTQVGVSATCHAATGRLAVRVTRNVDFDPNGFSLSVDGAVPTFVPAVFPGHEQAVPVSGLAAGAHKLVISGLAGHCVASPQNPIDFAVSAGTTAQVGVAVVCLSH